MITDVNGRRIRTQLFDKQPGQLTDELDVTSLPTGVYRLRILEGDRQTVRPFIKM